MELTKSLQETLDGMKLSVKYSTDNKNEVMCIWESGDAQTDEAIAFIFHKKINSEKILADLKYSQEDFELCLPLYLLENQVTALQNLENINKQDCKGLIDFCKRKRGLRAGKQFGF